MSSRAEKRKAQRKGDTIPEQEVGKYDPNGDKELFYAVHLDVTTEVFLAAREANMKKGRQVDFLFVIDGKKTEISWEEMVEFIESRHVEDIPDEINQVVTPG